MQVVVEIIDTSASRKDFEEVFAYFRHVDEKFSTYKSGSEITRLNKKEIGIQEQSDEMKEVFILAQKTKDETDGYFDIERGDGTYDPSGLVKGWAIHNAAKILDDRGFKNFSVEAGGDMEVRGKNEEGKLWRIGIRNPLGNIQGDFLKEKDIVKVIYGTNMGVATSGTYLLGQHIYDPHKRADPLSDIVSLTVIGPDIYEADRFATAAFAMGKKGIYFIEKLPGFEGYMIDINGLATMTTGFERFTEKHD